MELIPRWIKVSEDLPPEERLLTSCPFIDAGHEDDPHTGWYMGNEDGRWWCETCSEYIEGSKVVAWFALPPYKE